MNGVDISFNVDDSCSQCIKGREKIIKLQKQHKGVYGSTYLNSKRLVGKIEIVPDYNSNGILTHWHIR